VTIHLLTLIAVAQVTLVAGQIFLKHGMSMTREVATPLGRVTGSILAGVAMLAVWFFVWMGLLQKLDLSYVYPFEGISPILLVLAACVILKETLGWKSWVGISFITLGTILVGLS
jgi:uncharacterized membrane protein